MLPLISWLVASTPPNVDLPSDDASKASDVSVATVNSRNCDPQSLDEISVIAAPDLAAVLAAQDVTDVLLADLTAPLVTISLEEKALAPVAPLLRVPYLERLLEAVRDGTPLDCLPDALRPAIIQTCLFEVLLPRCWLTCITLAGALNCTPNASRAGAAAWCGDSTCATPAARCHTAGGLSTGRGC